MAHDKTEGPTTTLTFLGILIDSHLQQLRLPTDKLVPLRTEITAWLHRRTATKREVLSIVGKLSFAARVVPAGRLFLRRLIQLSTTAKCLHHHLRLNAEARADLQWWYDFLPSWNGVAMFINPDWTDADSLHLYTDASGTLGYGTSSGASGSAPTGLPTSYLRTSPSSGRSYSQCWPLPSHGATSGRESAFVLIVTTSQSSTPGMACQLATQP